MWNTRIGTVLLGLVGLGIGYLGITYLIDPVAQVPIFVGRADVDPAQALGNAKGVRDVATGVAVAVLLAARQWRVAGWFAVGGALIPVGDMLVVLADHGSPVTAFAVHGGAAAVTVLAGVLILRGSRRAPISPVADRVAA